MILPCGNAIECHKFQACCNKCVKLFSRYSKLYNVTQMLLELVSPPPHFRCTCLLAVWEWRFTGLVLNTGAELCSVFVLIVYVCLFLFSNLLNVQGLWVRACVRSPACACVWFTMASSSGLKQIDWLTDWHQSWWCEGCNEMTFQLR